MEMGVKRDHAENKVERYLERSVDDLSVEEVYGLIDLAPDLSTNYQKEVYYTLCDYITSESLIYTPSRSQPNWNSFKQKASEIKESEVENYQKVYSQYFDDDAAKEIKDEQLKMRLARAMK